MLSIYAALELNAPTLCNAPAFNRHFVLREILAEFQHHCIRKDDMLNLCGVETPFGGYGKSGYGREKGREALWNYVQTKNVAIKIGS